MSREELIEFAKSVALREEIRDKKQTLSNELQLIAKWEHWEKSTSKLKSILIELEKFLSENKMNHLTHIWAREIKKEFDRTIENQDFLLSREHKEILITDTRSKFINWFVRFWWANYYKHIQSLTKRQDTFSITIEEVLNKWNKTLTKYYSEEQIEKIQSALKHKWRSRK